MLYFGLYVQLRRGSVAGYTTDESLAYGPKDGVEAFESITFFIRFIYAINFEHLLNKNNTIDCYFRQYLCYKENMHLFVFANLYAYRTTKYEINTTNAFADNPKNHVINPLIGNNKDYKMLLVNLSERSICSFH